jgi:hypothetical protein
MSPNVPHVATEERLESGHAVGDVRLSDSLLTRKHGRGSRIKTTPIWDWRFD